ncbi:sigma-70 family RNA polymerase sigma factor [Embleya sp. NPDC050154]|uniref:sigma-70 family RNA polymerase sigma factor n=1 Tax=Embleya sp. NPDC050154 TaxID=3363988 RepID=UPI0037AAC6CF
MGRPRPPRRTRALPTSRSRPRRPLHPPGPRTITAELATDLGEDNDRVRLGLELGAALRSDSLDAPTTEPGGRRDTGHDRRGTRDPALELVVDRETLRPLIAELDDRDRRILMLRFWDDLTQAEIGQRLGMSQMHVSRLLNHAFTTLRTGILATT